MEEKREGEKWRVEKGVGVERRREKIRREERKGEGRCWVSRSSVALGLVSFGFVENRNGQPEMLGFQHQAATHECNSLTYIQRKEEKKCKRQQTKRN